MKKNSLKTYLEDPFLHQLMSEVKLAGGMRSSLVDITHKCNLRCVGCYYFMEKMDNYKKVEDDESFHTFVDQEVARGTNLLTVVGGEPALEIERLKILAKHFTLTVVTNGTMHIPMKDLENIRIAISFWGDQERDIELRGKGRSNVFETSLKLYKDDPRVGYYYTVIPGFTDGIQTAATRMVNNGNYVTFNFYGDLADIGGKYSHQKGFLSGIEEISILSKRYPTKIISSRYINDIISSRQMFGKAWGYDVCPSLTYDHPENAQRMLNGKQYPTKFRAYNADLTTTRRCCIGSARDCDTCTDVWAINGWVIGSFKEHLGSKKDFTNWLCSMYIFYMQTGFIDLNENAYKLPLIYECMDTLALSNQSCIPDQRIEAHEYS